MIKFFLVVVITLYFSACSFKKEPNDWQYKSADYFKEYQENFLSSNDFIAKNELSQAIKYAKKSSDLNTLAKIYLGRCALNISVGIEEKCEAYRNISDAVASEKLDAYYAFITKNLEDNKVQFLEKHYQEFVENGTDIFDMPRVSSTLLCASLKREELDNEAREKIVKIASYHGYKKVVLFWLKEQKKYLKNREEIEKIETKIAILSQN